MKILTMLLLLIICSTGKAACEDQPVPPAPTSFPLALVSSRNLNSTDLDKFVSQNQSVLDKWFAKDSHGKFEVPDDKADVTKNELCKLAGLKACSIKLAHTPAGKGIISERFISFSNFENSSNFKSALIDLTSSKIFYFDKESYFDYAEYFVDKSKFSVRAIGKVDGKFLLLHGNNYA